MFSRSCCKREIVENTVLRLQNIVEKAIDKSRHSGNGEHRQNSAVCDGRIGVGLLRKDA